MSISSDRVNCAICEWAGDYTSLTEEYTVNVPTPALYHHHFSSETHLTHYSAWCDYREEQNIPQDYVAEWLDQTSLADIHDDALVQAS